MSSILVDVKASQNIEAEYKHFDNQIIMFTNSALFEVNQLGIGPTTGLVIVDDSETWGSLLGERKDLEAVKTLIYLKVRLLFDPPSNSFLIESMNRQIQEFEWRLSIQAEPIVVEPVVEGGVV